MHGRALIKVQKYFNFGHRRMNRNLYKYGSPLYLKWWLITKILSINIGLSAMSVSPDEMTHGQKQ